MNIQLSSKNPTSVAALRHFENSGIAVLNILIITAPKGDRTTPWKTEEGFCLVYT